VNKIYLLSLICFFFYTVSYANAGNNSINGLPVTSLAVSPNGDLYAGTNEGLFCLITGDSIWYLVDNGLPTNTLVNTIYINSVGHIFVGYYYYQGVFRSIDGGDSWTSIGLASMSVYCLESKVPDTVFCGGDANGALFRSYTNGNSWTGIGNFYYVRSIGISNEGDIFLGTTSTGVWKSSDNGNNWVQTGLGYNYYVWAIAFDSLGTIYAGTEQGVYKSLDGGQSWIQINDGLFNTYIFSLKINYNVDLFAGTYEGLYVLYADSNHWTKTPLPNVKVGEIVIGTNNTIYAGTESGVYFSDDNGRNWIQLTNISPTGIEESKTQTFKSIILKQNYPNPFNPETTIKFYLPAYDYISLKIFNTLGQNVRNFELGYLKAGEQQILWNGDDDSGNQVMMIQVIRLHREFISMN
jgi:ligand-binding sensor domain-containing protein